MKPSWMRKLAKSLFGSSNKNKLKRSYSPNIEQLESRVNPSSVISQGGGTTLNISAGATPSNLIITYTGNTLTVTDPTGLSVGGFGGPTVFNVAVTGGTQYTLDLASNGAKSFSYINMLLGAFNDKVDIQSGLDFTVNPSGNGMTLSFDGGDGDNSFLYDCSQGIISSKLSPVGNPVFSPGSFDILNFDTFTQTKAPVPGGITLIQSSGANLNIVNDGPMTFNVSPTIQASTTLQASTAITIQNQINLNTNLTIQNVAATDIIPITATTTTGKSFLGSGNITMRTLGDINIEGSVNIGAGVFLVNNADNFTAQSDVTASRISMNSTTANKASVFSFDGNVTTTGGNFDILNLGQAGSAGARFFINHNAIQTATPGLTFNVAGNFIANSTGGFYDLTIAGTNATINNDIIIANNGQLIIGTVDNPATSPGTIASSNGVFDASRNTGPTSLFMNITAAGLINIPGSITVEAGAAVQSFTIQAQNGSISLLGIITLESDLTLWAGTGVNTDNGIITLQSVIGTSRILTINDCKGLTASSDIRVKELALQAKGGDSNNGAGQYVFEGNIGVDIAPTLITASSGRYGVQILGTSNEFGTALCVFNNTGTTILGNNSLDNLNFRGGSIFSKNTTVSGIGVSSNIDGVITINGKLAPGNLPPTLSPTNSLRAGVGVLTFNGPLILQDTNPIGSSVFYPDLLGNVPGVDQDQIITNKDITLINNPILYPLVRTDLLKTDTRFRIVNNTFALPVNGKFSGLTNLSSNLYSILNQGATFYASGGEFVIDYLAGDGNDVDIVFKGYAGGTTVYVDGNNVLNVLGNNGVSNVTAEISITGGVSNLNIKDPIYGLTGFAYGSKVVNNSIDILIGDATVVEQGAFIGFKVQQKGGSDTLNLINMNLQTVNNTNPNIDNVFFSFDGGPTSTPTTDIDTLNIIGINQNVVTLPIPPKNSLPNVVVAGYTFLHSESTSGVAANGILKSFYQGTGSLIINGNLNYDIGNITLASTGSATVSGEILLQGNAFLGNGVSLTLGDGSNSSITTNNLNGTLGGSSSTIVLNVLGNIIVDGSVGNDIDRLVIINSGVSVFTQIVDAQLITITNNTGGITFKGEVGSIITPTINIETVNPGSNITFEENLFAVAITGATGGYGINFLGTNTSITQFTSLSNTGGIVLGDSLDTLTFSGGLTIGLASPVSISGTVQSSSGPINISTFVNGTVNPNVALGINLTSNSLIRTTFGSAISSAPITLGRVLTNGFALTLDAGQQVGSSIIITQLRGKNGSLDIINSAGTTISQVGMLSYDTNPNEVFGVISIRNSINEVLFDGPVLVNKLNTFYNDYSVRFAGSTDATVTNDQRIFIIMNTSPTVFLNRGDVTFGVNGSATGSDLPTPSALPFDLIMFNGGVDTSLIAGSTNVGSRLYTNNTNIVFDDLNITADAFLNTYLSSNAFSVSYLNPGYNSLLSIVNTPPTIQNPPISGVALQNNILALFGYVSGLGQNIFPSSTGSIFLGDVVNNSRSFQLNAGGSGSPQPLVTGNISFKSYEGLNRESLNVYSANDVTFFGNVSGYNMLFGVIANGGNSQIIRITGTVGVQGDFTVTNNFQVSKDVNNVSITGNINTISGSNNISNMGFVQLGNNQNDIFNVSVNFNLNGPSERRIGGLFNITNAKILDFGPGITSLVANTVVTTNSQIGTTIGQINNNAFSLTINGKTQIQHYVADNEIAPYPSSTNPPSYIPVNSILGAGTGGGNVIFNGEVILQLNNFVTGNVVKIPTTTNLRKQGTGSVFLNTDSSTNTAGLLTTIENGNFFFENAKINAATVTSVAGNGLLGGTKGTLGAVNVLPRGQLSPGNLTNSIGVLNLQGNLSVQSTYKVDIRSVAFNLFDQVNVTGAVSLARNNVNGILDVAFTPDASVTIGNAFGIISNDGTDLVTGNFVTVGGRALTQNSTFTVNMPDGVNVATFQISYTGNIAANGTASLTGGNDVVIQITGIQSISSTLAAKSQNPNKLFAVSTDSGGGPIVKISFADGSGFSFFAYDTSFTGGVRTAIGDVNGDGTPDLITAAGPGGGPHVVIWTITPGVPYATVQSGFFAFEPGFTGGITLATGNINGDVSSSNNAFDDIIVGAGAGGGPRVKAFAGNANFAAINNQSQLVDFFAYAPEFNLGVNVAAGDRTGDSNDEIITGAAQGGGPHVQVWQISNGTANSIQSFFAFDPSYLCGVFVGSGDLDGDSLADIYTGTGSGPIGSVGIYFGNGAVSRLEPFGSGFTGGVRVGAALGALNSNTNTYPPYLLTAAGPGGGPQVSLFDSNLNIVDAFFAFQENFTGGVLASTTVNT
jgi:hypothetical protein